MLGGLRLRCDLMSMRTQICWMGPCPGWSNADPHQAFRLTLVEDSDPGDESGTFEIAEVEDDPAAATYVCTCGTVGPGAR